MNLTDRNILIISPEAWEHIQISKHHYAIELAKRNNRVYFLGPPENEYAINTTSINNLFKVTYKGFPKGFRFYPKAIRKKIQRSLLEKIEKITGCTLDILWSFDNSVFADFDNERMRLNISHIVDKSQDFLFARAASTADINFAVSENIFNRQKKYNQQSYLIPHAIDELFLKEIIKDSNSDLPGKNKIKALTFGNMNSPYINWKLAEKIYNHFDCIDFIHFGPKPDKAPIAENIYFAGFKDKKDLAVLMSSADFLFIFYDDEKYPEQLTNSHKILEFLSSGKPVICNPFSDYKKSELLIQCHNLEDYKNAIQNTITKSEDVALKQRRIEYASKNTYNKRIEEIEQILENINV
ncbi:hypothetical protein HZR84_10550 [Hyphobacterium sp. CCMP332]|nr:hypothetical protein HZR84_10550 [Hyphobacterium sp. CCMP332]